FKELFHLVSERRRRTILQEVECFRTRGNTSARSALRLQFPRLLEVVHVFVIMLEELRVQRMSQVHRVPEHGNDSRIGGELGNFLKCLSIHQVSYGGFA